jgi:DNA repair protein RadC
LFYEKKAKSNRIGVYMIQQQLEILIGKLKARKLLLAFQHESDLICFLRNPDKEVLTSLIGEKKADSIMSAISLGRDLFIPSLEKRIIIDDISKASACFRDLFFLPQERFAIAMLKTNNEYLYTKTLFTGGTDECSVSVKLIFKEAIQCEANRIIVAHNHPSGDLTPSYADLELTQKMIFAGMMVGIQVLDHLILGNGDYLSMRATTDLWKECDN